MVVGNDLNAFVGDELSFYGVKVKVAAKLDKTGTTYDTAVFTNKETIIALIESSLDKKMNEFADIDPNKVVSCILVNVADDSVVEEFKGTANMELTLDQSIVRAGVSPAINLQHSFTKNSDILLDQKQKEGLSLIRAMLANTSSATAIPQLVSMMDKASTNEELLLKMKDWFALMNR